jgi:hypothetical protein
MLQGGGRHDLKRTRELDELVVQCGAEEDLLCERPDLHPERTYSTEMN